MFTKVLSAILLAAPLVFASVATESAGTDTVIEAFISDSNPHYHAAHEKLVSDPSYKVNFDGNFPTASESCEKIRTVLVNKKYEDLADLTHKWVFSVYDNDAMPFRGLYIGQQGLMSLGHRIKQTATSSARDIKIAGYDNARDMCVLRIKGSGKFNKSGKEYKDLVMYVAMRFHLGKALMIGLFDGHTSMEATKLYREGTSEGLAHNFAKTVYRNGYDSEKTQKLIHPDVKFAFSALGHRGVMYKGKAQFSKFGKFMKNVRKNFRTLPMSLPLLAPKNKFCRTIVTGENNIVDMCIFTNVMTKTGVLHKAIRIQRAMIFDPKTKTVSGLFVHVMNNLRLKDIIDDDDEEYHENDEARIEAELASEDAEDLMFGEVEDADFEDIIEAHTDDGVCEYDTEDREFHHEINHHE